MSPQSTTVALARPALRLTLCGISWCALALAVGVLGVAASRIDGAVVAAMLIRGGIGAWALVASRALRYDPARSLSTPLRIALPLAPPALFLLGMSAVSQPGYPLYWAAIHTERTSPFFPDIYLSDHVPYPSNSSDEPHVMGIESKTFMLVVFALFICAFVLGLAIAFARRRPVTSPPTNMTGCTAMVRCENARGPTGDA